MMPTQVREYLTIALGQERLSKILVSMCCPPLETCVRINTQRCSTDEALHLLQAHLEDRHDRDASLQPHVHPVLKNVLCIPGTGGHIPNYSAEGVSASTVLNTSTCSTHPDALNKAPVRAVPEQLVAVNPQEWSWECPRMVFRCASLLVTCSLQHMDLLCVESAEIPARTLPQAGCTAWRR